MIKIYTNINSEIKALHFSDDKGLTCHTFDEESDSYPFRGWSDARILCYRIEVDEEGRIKMMTPYVDTNIIEQIERLELTKASQETVDEMQGQTLDMAYQICLLQLGVSDIDINPEAQEGGEYYESI